MDAISTLSPEDMAAAISSLTDKEREYFKMLVSHMVRGFSDPAYSCVLVVGMHDTGTVAVCSVRAIEQQAADLLAHAHSVMGFAGVVPDKGEIH